MSEAPMPEPPKVAPTLSSYTLPGVLQFLQMEWRKFERERNEWEIEKSDLKVYNYKRNLLYFFFFFFFLKI